MSEESKWTELRRAGKLEQWQKVQKEWGKAGNVSLKLPNIRENRVIASSLCENDCDKDLV